MLTAEEEVIAVAFRQHTLLPLDDCLAALQKTIPHLAHSALHRWLKCQGAAADFLRRVLERLPCKVPILTKNWVQLTPQPLQFLPGGHSFARTCREYGVEHRLTKPAHPRPNGQGERFNRTIKETTVQRYHHQSTAQLSEHL